MALDLWYSKGGILQHIGACEEAKALDVEAKYGRTKHDYLGDMNGSEAWIIPWKALFDRSIRCSIQQNQAIG